MNTTTHKTQPPAVAEAAHTKESEMARIIEALPARGFNALSGAKQFSIDEAFDAACEQLAVACNNHAALEQQLTNLLGWSRRLNESNTVLPHGMIEALAEARALLASFKETRS